MSPPSPAAAPAGAPCVWFLSDYGLDDEFVGVCRAVARRAAPGVEVVDLTHGIAPFAVAAGAAALARAMPWLGPGAVLAVVDPGVGGARRGVAVEVAAGDGPRWLVGPDNGLLLPAAAVAGGPLSAWELFRPPGPAATFDGRDVFAPAAAALAAGAPPQSLAAPVDPAGLVHLEAPVAEVSPGRVAAAVTWVDRFGNAALAVEGGAVPPGARASVRLPGGGRMPARRVRTFGDLAPGELGLLADASGSLALVADRDSAARRAGIGPGDVVVVQW